MESFVNNYLENNKSNSKSTKTTFITNIKRLEKFLKTPFNEWNKDTFKNSNTILDNLINDYSNNTNILNILTIIRYLEYKKVKGDLVEDYKDFLNELINERNNTDNKQELKEGEKTNWIQYTELKNKVEEKAQEYLNKKKAYSDYRNFLILSLFSLQPPTRTGNYLNMKYKTKNKRDIEKLSKKFNYVSPDGEGKWKFIFNNYKTSKYLGKIVLKVSNETLNKLITKWFNDYNIKKKDFLNNVSGKPITQTNFTNAQKSISKKLLGKELTTNLFRHIFLTWFLSNNPSIEEKQKIAEIIGQKYKVSRMELYERRNDNGKNITEL
jgi:hypothetical protein